MSGRKKSLSHHLSRREPDDNELDAAMKEFSDGPDRVAAIMGAALVERHLISAIQTVLVDCFNENSLFHDQGAPFGTFKARILAGRALGLFDAQIAEDMDIIRDIRNQFAHALLSIGFDNEHLASRCMGLREYSLQDENGDPIGDPKREKEVSPARARYEHVCWSLSILLLQKMTQLLRGQTSKLKSEIDRLQDSLQPNALSDMIAASLQSRAKDVEDDITPHK